MESFIFKLYRTALYYDLPVYRDTYKLILKIFEFTKDFSKEYKYTLGQDLKRDSYQNRVRAGADFDADKDFYSTYTPIVVDLIDEENQRNTRGHNGSADWPIDRVNGYTISQIETSFKKSKTWTEWRTNLFNDHTNSTENSLQELFDNW